MRSYKVLEIEEAEKIRKLRPPELRGINEKARTIEHVITTDSPDRDGDIIEADGWDLKEFEENPVVLFGHRHDEEPIARNIEIKTIENGLQAVTQFPPEGIHERADRLFELNKLGFIRSWSVGFLPIEAGPREHGKGIHFRKQKLLEYSNVPIPSNMEAVNLAVSKGLVTAKDLEVLGWPKGGLISPEVRFLNFPGCDISREFFDTLTVTQKGPTQEIIQEEFSKQTLAIAFEMENQRLEEALRKISGARA